MMSQIDFSIAGSPVYPHIKLTREAFPRALATRILNDDGDEYFGAFLNRTSVRILIDFLNRTFRLRSCSIEIDGSFAVPCTQHYARRCVAPCVASLCNRDQYLEIVDLARLFLRNERELFLASISKKIELAAERLEFETAAFLRDVLENVERFWANKRWRVWLDDTVDTFVLDEQEGITRVILVSQRRRRPLGELIFTFAKSEEVPSAQALHDVIQQFYKYHLPRAIRVSHDFPGRNELAKKLGSRFGKKLAITVTTGALLPVTTERALDRTMDRLKLESISRRPTVNSVKKDLKRIFDLSRIPDRIEAFDVAHISATGFAAGYSVWENGKDLPNEYRHWLSDETSELGTLRAFITRRLNDDTQKPPDLILIDGGRSHLGAALESAADVTSAVVAAVKPRAKHSSISHFLKPDGERVEFDPDREAFRLLKRLRDDAHDLANATHRLSRDMMHFYELASIVPSLNASERQGLLRDVSSIRKIVELDLGFLQERFGKQRGSRAYADLESFKLGQAPPPQPLIVPIRFVETDGAAEDLRPIETR